MKIKVSNTFLIFVFVIFVFASILNSKEFKNFSSFFFKKDDEIFYKFKILKHNHYVYLRAKKNPNSIGFIKELSFEKSLKSFVNKPSRSHVFIIHNHWGIEKAKEIYKIHGDNVFRLPFYTEKFLNENQLDILEKCSETRKKNFSSLFNEKTASISLANMENHLSRSLYYFKLKINTPNEFLSLVTLDKKQNIINRSEISLVTHNHHQSDSFTNKIVNSYANIILLDVGSENNSGVHNQVTQLWFLYYVNNYEHFDLVLNFYNSKNDFILHSDISDVALEYKINSENKNFQVLEDYLKIIPCK